MTTHPYAHAPTYTKWRHAVAAPEMAEVDPAAGFPFRLSRHDRVATAGSCFAQHIGRSLRAQGFGYFVTEPPHPIIADIAASCGYDQFSARYGNIYTVRQMLQLVQRAFGLFRPIDDVWRSPTGAYHDPYRPTVQPGGYISRAELEDDRAHHLHCVRRLFEELDYLVFTLGLTEAWISAADGAVYPLCPGVAAGTFDAERHKFVNFDVSAITADVESFFRLIKSVNVSARLILTVSPVALAATAENKHVLLANTYSKAVLRVVAETLSRRHPDEIAYFPSYEIVTGIHSRGCYVLPDLRSVSNAGVAQVMAAFSRHALAPDREPTSLEAPRETAPPRSAIGNILKAECDEIMLGT